MKQQFLDQLVTKMKGELEVLQKAYNATKSLATDQEFKAESKYDTRSLEASYLAGAEAERIEEMKQEIDLLLDMDLKSANLSQEIGMGSLVELDYQGNKKWYFLIPIAGGSLLEFNGQPILVVSVFSPIGSSMLGLKVGDEFEVETPGKSRIYQVSSLK